MTINTIQKISNSTMFCLVLLLCGIFFWLAQEISQTYDLQKDFYQVDALVSELRVLADAKQRLLMNAARTPEDGQLEEWDTLHAREDGSRPRPSTSFLHDYQGSLETIAQQVYFLDGHEMGMLHKCISLNQELSDKGRPILMRAHGLYPDQEGKYTVVGKPEPAKALQAIYAAALDQIPQQLIRTGQELRELIFGDFHQRMKEQRADLARAIGLAGVILLALAVFIGASSIFVHRRVSVPLARVSRYAEDVAEDKNPHPLDIAHDDELSRMYVSLEKMKYALIQRIEALDIAHRAARDSQEQTLRANNEAVKALQKAQIMSRTQEDFLRRISHEVRTPLNAITGMSHLCMQTRLDGTQRDYLAKISEAGHALLGMFNRMLDLSSMVGGNMRLELARFPLVPFLERVREEAAPKVGAKNLHFVANTPLDLPGTVYGDEAHLEEVLHILLDNAVKFTEEGQVELSCTLTAAGLLRFTVADTGPGINDDVRESIFAPYQDGSRAGEAIHQGLGLGLALANNLVSLMGSSLVIESHEGMGTRISFELPCEQENVAAESPQPEADARPTRAPIVLVADDNEINLQIDEELLEQAGITAVLVNNGQEAVDYMRDNEADLVLMDMQMPVLNGIEATRCLREMGYTREKLPILAMTAHTDDGSRQDGQMAGMNDYLTKPIDPAHLYERLAHWLPGFKFELPDVADEDESAREEQFLNEGSDGGEYVNVAAGLATLGNNKKLYAELLQHFAGEYAQSAKELRTLLESGDLVGAGRLVHTLKGTTANLGLMPLNGLAVAMEGYLPQKAPSDDLVAAFDATLQATFKGIDSLLLSDDTTIATGTNALDEQARQSLCALLADLPARAELDWGTTENALAAMKTHVAGTMHAEAFARVIKAVNSFDLQAIQAESKALSEQLQARAA